MQYIFTIDPFFPTLGNDFKFLKDTLIKNQAAVKNKQNEESTFKKVVHAAIRIFATIGMMAGVCHAILAFRRFSIIFTPLKLAIGILIYALSHDVFKISQNASSLKKSIQAETEGLKTGLTVQIKSVADNVRANLDETATELNHAIQKKDTLNKLAGMAQVAVHVPGAIVNGVVEGFQEGADNINRKAEKARLQVYTEGTLLVRRLIGFDPIWNLINKKMEERLEEN